MKDGKKIRYNLIVGVLGQLVTLLLGIVIPKIVLTNYGSEVNGLLSSVTNIYAYIAIAEAGVAAASCQALYKAIADNDCSQMNAVLSATNRYYHKTGLIYLFLIFAFSSLYPVFIHSEIPYVTVFLVILFNGLGNVINYFFHGKYKILLKADGRNFVRNGLDLLITTAKHLSKIVLIACGFDVVMVQFIAMLISFIQMLCITLYIKKHYSWIDLNVKPDFEAISQSKHVFVHEINYMITSNLDTVLLTIFTTLKTVSVYSIYALFISTVTRMLRMIKEGLEFKIAHEFYRDRQKFIRIFEAYEVFYITFAFSVFTVVTCFILPFLRVYTKGVTDIDYIQTALPYAFVLIQLLEAGRYPSDAMVHISGHFQQTRNSASIETAINLVTSLILVNIFGIVGALAGTVIASLYRTNYLIIYINKRVIGRGVKTTYFCWTINFLIYLVVITISRHIHMPLDSYIQIIGCAVPYTVCVILIYFLVVALCIPSPVRYVLELIRCKLKKE